MKKNIVIFLMFLFSINVFAQNLPFYAPQQAIIRIKKETYATLSFQKFQRPFIITSNVQLNGLFAQLKVYRMERLLPEEENTPFGIRSGINRSFVIYFESQQALDNILDLLRSNAAIERATPNFLYSTSDVIPKDKIDKFELFSAYPNPFNPTTTISYQLPQTVHVTVAIYDIQGRLVETLVDGEKTAGRYSVQWHGENVPSGVYFYRIQAGHFTATKKLLLLK